MSKEQLAVSIFPNPSNGIVHIECSGAKQLLITDYLGRIVKQFKVNSEQLIVDVKDLPKGMYIVQVLLANGKIVNSKLVVE